MLRQLHSIPGLIAAALLIVVTLTGAALSIQPALERAAVAGSPRAPLDVATLAGRVSAQVPGVEKLVRRPSGEIVAYYAGADGPRASIVDPSTGAPLADYRPSPVVRWLTNLHRKFLLGDAGRIATGVTAAAMLFIALSGLALLAHRMGGWRRLAGPIRGDGLQRLHNETARVALAGLVLSALTGLVLSLSTFGVIPERGAASALALDARPGIAAAAKAPIPIAQMAALRATDWSTLRQLSFPAPDEPRSLIELKTTDGAGFIDPATGAALAYQPADGWQRLHALVKMLHTGEGLWWLGLVLGASSLATPLLAVTGVMLWARRRRAQPKRAGDAPARDADTVLLVGSEGNSTWGFASALQAALAQAGRRVHVAPMNDGARGYPAARHVLVLSATYGDGDAPGNAQSFLPKLARLSAAQGASFAVLGFGDRQFPRFCGYARSVHDALVAKGLTPLLDLGTVDRQSEPEFRAWCARLGDALGLALDVRHAPTLPRTMPLTLVERDDYGGDPRAMTSVLRFAPAGRDGRTGRADRAGRDEHDERDGRERRQEREERLEDAGRRAAWWTAFARRRLPSFETGDLLGVVPPGEASPRYYSLASASSDGIVEICVRRHPHGVCSRYLTGLQPGDTIEAFVRPHARLRPHAGAAPVILIGAGTGIGPLIGFIRHNAARRPMHLYFGARNANDGFPYRDELDGLVRDRRLRALTTAFSRAERGAYVQDRLVADARNLRELVAHGAQIMVCGGRAMADGVARAWERILADSGSSVAQLKQQGRYVEDVY
ncbi:PepSY domain-containing protein [Burkholderia pseudomallei]|uniref:PepSY domain-containing protein n=1 Tax=Burkholderia pseudomallei TaxID=28450 RepID=UPI001A9D1E74|nr:PepSY domain-containing protein [Burkholderia pseudomallei]MBO7782423.1 PepSY domain-containing protein [Burkholderia pseudomallei]MBO7792707.1 PepSY domain-containing protein [Burkholderia pseudomallei]MBO7865827.1 PepSY domain-containing protein [Burkholderia pseudomallei]MBO7877985.1 PepSY domain-containing protein [Burkholderia pseudomallei]QTB40393.1 PepSY domain-containing protein [Burkholderia pseudomallei]